MTSVTTPARRFYEFGLFRLDLSEQMLLREGKPVPLTPKAIQTLLVLVENSGRTVTKEELLNRVWPDTFVEEITLAQNISTLRKALEDDRIKSKYIETVPRRGYRFVAKVNEFPSDGVEIVVAAHPILAKAEEASDQTSPVAPGDATEAPRPAAERSIISLKRKVGWLALVVLAAILVLGAGAYLSARRGKRPISSLEVRSIAVLPFKPLVEENRDEPLELGMADALITKLSNIKQIIVRPTSSILKYRDLEYDPLDVGREQNVDSLLEGKVQRSGDNVRVTVQLLRVSDGLPLWAATFDEKFTNIFSVQDSISRKVAEALLSELSGEQRQQLAKRYTDNIEAYNLYVKGRFFWNKFDEDGLQKAIEYFKRAIAIDPDYALAYTGLSVSYNVQGAIGILPPAETWAEARRNAQKAVDLDDKLEEAHSALGGVKLLYEWDWPIAEKELKRAIEINPNYAEAHELYGYYFEAVGDLDKALSELKRAQELAPLSQIINSDVSAVFYFLGNYSEAINAYRKAQEIDPRVPAPPFTLGQIYERNGEYGQAIKECQSALAAFGRDPAILTELGYVYAVSGSRNKAQEIIEELEAMWEARYFSPTGIALVYTGLGNKDKAFVWLTKAYESRDPQLIWLRVEPQFAALQQDSRFRVLMQRIGLAH